MQESYWGYWMILLGIFVIVVMMLIQSVTTGNTQDYLMMKEVTQAAMVDSVDFAYYRMYGEVKMNKEKFVENFIRRFSENVNISTKYRVAFYDLYEVPPKVTVRVSSKSNSARVTPNSGSTSFDIVNDISAILEFGYTNEVENPGGSKKTGCTLYMMPKFVEEYKKYLTDELNDSETAENITSLEDVKKDFAKRFGDISSQSTTWDVLRSKYPKISEWIDKGLLLESK